MQQSITQKTKTIHLLVRMYKYRGRPVCRDSLSACNAQACGTGRHVRIVFGEVIECHAEK